ncbi:hypothetical protein VTN00DRAFT_9625 [Thermoascus crustaceus]|uniref:uncharacterized protein n=1 Tax=Thermoascus crustaceus TaxID=5088 RepID=UPI003743DD0C
MRPNSFSIQDADSIYPFEPLGRWDESSTSRHTESTYPPINITNVLPAQNTQPAISSTPTCSENTIVPSANSPGLHITGLLDVAVKEYSDWQQSRFADEALKAEVRKACDAALDDGLDLEQIDDLKDPEYFKKRGVKWGIARRFVKDIKYWADNYKCNAE